MTRVACLLAVATIAVIGAGCGADEQNAYADQVNALQRDLVAEVTAAVSEPAPANANRAAEVAVELSQIFTTSADEFEAVLPPEQVADLHRRLVEEIRSIGNQIATAEKAFKSGNAQRAAAAAAELQGAVQGAQTQLNRLIDEINAELQS